MTKLRNVLAGVSACLLFCSVATAQTVESSISGNAADPSGLPVAGASVTLTDQLTNFVRTEKSGVDGGFLFLSVAPGQYAVSLEAAGFKKLTRDTIHIAASDRVALGRIVLEVGSLEQSITVRAEGTFMDSENSDHKAIMTDDQLTMLQSRDRNMLSFLNTLPGVVGSSAASLDNGGALTPFFNGVDNNMNAVMSDGQSGNDVSNPRFYQYSPNLDAISQVTVLTNSFKAEYGRNGGPVIVAVTKSGTREFHGSGFTYFRNESLNANDFFNNQLGLPRPIYRYGTYGFTVGGPIYWPGKFNSSRQKLFFFESVEIVKSRPSSTLSQWTVPTALERQGDFSQSLNTGGQLIVIKDPLSNKTPFPGNTIPASRLDASGKSLLNIFPLPNFFNRAISRGNYNYNFQDAGEAPTSQELIRVDYYATSKLRLFFRGFTNHAPSTSYTAAAQLTNWPLMRMKWDQNMPGALLNGNYTFSPTVLLDLSAGLSGKSARLKPAEGGDYSAVTRAKYGIKLPQLFSGNNPFDVLPTTAFGGVPNAANIAPRGDFPSTAWTPRWVINGSLTKVAGPHTIKAGFYNERIHYFMPPITGSFNGSFNFTSDANNPLDTGYAYANAILGNFQSYTEASARAMCYLKSMSFDWYLQDTWRATRRLTLDYGMRFVWFAPYYQSKGDSANFIPSKYDPAQKVMLYTPVTVGGQRLALDPRSGKTFPAAYVGAIIPGTGNAANGVIHQDAPGVPRGFAENRGIHKGPRVGLAYDLFGDGKTVFRAGFGVSFATQMQMAYTQPIVTNTVSTPTIYYGSFSNFDPTAKVLFPTAITGVDQLRKAPTILGLSGGIQRRLGLGTVMDVSYVGTLGRNLPQNASLNTIPYFSQFLPQNAGLSNNFIAPYIGFAGITYYSNPSNSSYNSLQVQVNRRYSRRVQYGLSYTWSKTLGYVGTVSQYLDGRLSHGRTSLDRSHRLTLNYLYDIPAFANRVPFRPAHWALDGWQLSGICTFQTGAPFAVSYTFSPTKNITGGGDWTRVNMVGNPNLDHPDFYHAFNTAAIAPPVAEAPWGNAPVDVFRGPGINNFDVSLFKNFVVRERFRFQLRGEAFNVFNHPSFYTVNTAAQFNPNTGAQLNSALGQYTDTREARQMQVALRLSF